jgi:hypothetical protein
LTAASLQPPPQGPEANPKVTYDPCTRIPDSVIAEAGYNPPSRRRFHDAVDGRHVLLACQFLDNQNGPAKQKFDLRIGSTNESFSDWRQNAAGNGRVTPLRVDGRDGFQYPDPLNFAACRAYLATNAGYVVLYRERLPAGPNDACDGMTRLVTLIEPTIGAAS